MGYKTVSYKSILLLLLVIFLASNAFAVVSTPVITIIQPTGIGTSTGSIDVNFNVFDFGAGATFDGNIWLSTTAGGFTHLIVNDNNLLDTNVGVGKLNCIDKAGIATTGMNCHINFDTRKYANLDGNYFIDFNVTDDAGTMGIGSSLTFMIDNNAPTITIAWYSEWANTWKTTCYDINFACNDGNGSGCQSINHTIDQNPAATVSLGALTVYGSAEDPQSSRYLMCSFTDGNWAIDFNATDNAGLTNDLNRIFYLYDSTAPNNSGASTDFTADVNQTGASSTDRFVGIDQNIRLRIAKLPDTSIQTSPYVDVNVLFTDINSANTTVYKTTALADGNYTIDYNMGNFDINFTTKYVTIRIRDQAGNQVDRNILNPIIPYTMTRPTGLDNNSTNFQTVTNFEAISNLIFAKSGLGQIKFTQDVNIGTYAQAEKLMQLENALSISQTGPDNKDMNVTINSAVFADINKAALISMYGLPKNLSSTPRIAKDDGNCGSFCTGISYNSSTGDLNFNVSQFSSYNSDTNAPVLSGAGPTTTQTAASFNLVLTTNEAATCRYGTSDVNYDSMTSSTTSLGTSHSWSLAGQISGTTTYYFECRDKVSNDANTSLSVTVSIASTTGGSNPPVIPPTTTPPPEAPSITPPTTPTVVATETNVIPLAIAGETVKVPIETAGIGVTQLQIELANAVSNASVTLSVIETPPAETGSLAITVVPATGGMGETVAPKVYQYLQIEKQNITNEDITKATIGFKVEKSWLQANGLNASDVALYRFTNEWNALNTSFAYETADAIFYTAVTPGFSYFAIGEKPKVEAAPMPRVITEEPIVPVEEIAPTGLLPILPAVIPEAAPVDYSSLVAIIIIIIVVGIAVYLIKEKKL